jgi:hypothetical protein
MKNYTSGKIYYSAFGSSSELNTDILSFCSDISSALSKLGWILRSGAEKGIDTAFEYGCDKVNGTKDIYLPYRNYNNNDSNNYYISLYSLNSVKQNFCKYSSLTYNEIRAKARNYQILLGQNLSKPSNIALVYNYDSDDDNVKQLIEIAQVNVITVIDISKLYGEKIDKIIEAINDRII